MLLVRIKFKYELKKEKKKTANVIFSKFAFLVNNVSRSIV